MKPKSKPLPASNVKVSPIELANPTAASDQECLDRSAFVRHYMATVIRPKQNAEHDAPPVPAAPTQRRAVQ